MAIAAAVALFVLLRGGDGTLVVTVTGPGGTAVEAIEVYVDGKKQCDTSPCRIDKIEDGPHLLRASAKGFQPTADQAVSVQSGRHNTQNIELVRAAPTGVKVTAIGTGLKLWVDGNEVGDLPQTITDMEPGEHVLRVGGPRYEDWEQRVQVEREKVQTIGPLKLKVLKGLASFKAGPGADGARVLLDGRVIPDLPATIEVPGGKSLSLVATKDGYGTYRRTVRLDEGEAEKTFEITMVESGGGTVVEPDKPAPNTGRRGGGGGGGGGSAKAAGKAVLNMNSIPVSMVILNGRPLGQTPKTGIKVDPGRQTVVFVHPQHGRKVQSATVAAGSSKTFMVKFP